MTTLMRIAVVLPPLAKTIIVTTLSIVGLVVLIGAIICLARASHRQKKLHLSNPLPTYSVKGKNSVQSTLQNLPTKSETNKR